MLFLVDSYVPVVGNDFLILRQYCLLDNPPRFSVGRKSNIPAGAIAQFPSGKRDKKTRGIFDDLDVMHQKAIVETNGSIGSDEFLVGWTDSDFRDLHV